jgi:hypothetical protein
MIYLIIHGIMKTIKGSNEKKIDGVEIDNSLSIYKKHAYFPG